MEINKISKLKDSLERLFKDYKSHPLNSSEFYFAIYHFIDFIETTPFLKKIIDEEDKRQNNHEDEIRETMDDTPFMSHLNDYRHFNFCLDYIHIHDKIYFAINDLKTEINPHDMDPLGLALIRDPQSLPLLGLDNKGIERVLSYQKKYKTDKFANSTNLSITRIYNGFMNILTEFELDPSKIEEHELTQTIKKLKITPETKWEDISIIFLDEFRIKIKYKNQEEETDYEQMGFADRRKQDQTSTKASWKLLEILSTNNGIFLLPKVNQKEKEKHKKQKQELSKLLKNFFNISDDPFYKVDKENKEYKIKIKLTPDPDLRPGWRDRHIYNDDKKEFLKSV